jgi:hypothetical protein
VLAAGCGTAVTVHSSAPRPPAAAHSAALQPTPAHHPRHSQPVPATVTAPPSAPAITPANPIPQGNGGDQDTDNNGGPSDGDGNI